MYCKWSPIILLFAAIVCRGQSENKPEYVLGPDDQVVIRAMDAEEIAQTPYRVDAAGNLDLPLAGTIHAAGLTVEAFKQELIHRLKAWVKQPMVTVSLVDFRNQPISILGAVTRPGAYQVRGNKTLFEVLSMAEGLRPDAGNTIKITRQKRWGPLPLANVAVDRTGEYLVGEVKVKAILEAQSPEDNIIVHPYDVISVPKAELIYVTGCVHKSGGFVLNEREKMSVLQALSMAEGLNTMSAAGRSRILRQSEDGSSHVELPVDITKILEGKAEDISLKANDILFIPTSAAKNGALRALEVAIQLGTGIAIYHH